MVVVGCVFFQAEDGIRDLTVTGVQTCALPICALRAGLEQRRLIGLAVAHLHAAAERLAARGAEPMPRSRGECAARQQRMIVSLHDDERVALAILRRHVPGLLGVAVPSAQAQAGALAERIERQSLVGPEPLSGGGFDGPGGPLEEARQKLAKRDRKSVV